MTPDLVDEPSAQDDDAVGGLGGSVSGPAVVCGEAVDEEVEGVVHFAGEQLGDGDGDLVEFDVEGDASVEGEHQMTSLLAATTSSSSTRSLD
jgi:hypothetical protein